MITSSPNSIIITPIGNLEISLLEKICAEVTNRFGYNTKIAPLLQDAEFAFDPVRKQYHSTRILRKLSALIPQDTLKVLAVYNKDLFIPILTHVYGEAQLGGKSCIISLLRLKENMQPVDRNLIHQRIIKEALHELGHAFNLRHCPDQICCMHYCRSIDDVDRKSDRFCRYCGILLSDEMKKLECK